MKEEFLVRRLLLLLLFAVILLQPTHTLAVSPPPDDTLGNAIDPENLLYGTWYCIDYGVHGYTEYYWSFKKDGRFAYYVAGFEPPHGGGEIDSSVSERLMQGSFRENGITIECYDVQADSYFAWGNTWRYFPDKDPALLASALFATPLRNPEDADDFSLDFEIVSKSTLHLEIDQGAFPDQYAMDFEYAGTAAAADTAYARPTRIISLGVNKTALTGSKTTAILTLGQEVSINVSANETTPYRWIPVLSDETVMELVDDGYIQDFNPLGYDGVGGKQRYVFRAIGPGVCSVDLYHVYIGDTIDEAVSKKTYLYTVEEAPDENTNLSPAGPPQDGVPLLAFLDNPALTAFAEHFEEDFPVSVAVRHDGEASGVPVVVTDPEIIRAVFESLRNITVIGEWPVSGHTDDYLNYYFEMTDGRSIYGFVFQSGMLLDETMGLHVITGFDMLQRALPAQGL